MGVRGRHIYCKHCYHRDIKTNTISFNLKQTTENNSAYRFDVVSCSNMLCIPLRIPQRARNFPCIRGNLFGTHPPNVVIITTTSIPMFARYRLHKHTQTPVPDYVKSRILLPLHSTQYVTSLRWSGLLRCNVDGCSTNKLPHLFGPYTAHKERKPIIEFRLLEDVFKRFI